MLTFFDSSSNCLNSASAISEPDQQKRNTLISADVDKMAKELGLTEEKGESLSLGAGLKSERTFAESMTYCQFPATNGHYLCLV